MYRYTHGGNGSNYRGFFSLSFGRNSHKKLWVIVNVRNSGKISLLISFSFGRPLTIFVSFRLGSFFYMFLFFLVFTRRAHIFYVSVGYIGARMVEAPPTQNGLNKDGCRKINDVTQRISRIFLLLKVMQEIEE